MQKMEHQSKNCMTSLCFFAMGFWISVAAFTISWIAIEDLLAGTTWSTTIVLIVISVPEVFSKVLSPIIVRRISFLCSMIVLTVMLAGSLLMIVLVENVTLRFIGVAFLGIAYGFGLVTCYHMLAYYDNADDLASAFKFGTNISTYFASLGYTGLTTWLCVAPRLAVAGLIPLCFLPILFYAFLNKEPLSNQSTKSATNHHDIKYTALEDQTPQKTNVLLQVFEVIPFFTYMFIGSCSLQLSLAAVLSTLTFPNSPFPPRDHYQYYRLLSDVGLFFGGIEIVLVPCLCSQWIEHLKIRKLWIPVSLNVGCFMFFLFASWYRFVPNVYFVLALVVVQGLLQGTNGVNQCIGRAASR